MNDLNCEVDQDAAHPRYALAVVRDLADLEPALEQFSAFKAFCHDLVPAKARPQLLGIWVEERAVHHLPDSLLDGSSLPHDEAALRVVEVTGIPGRWLFCQLLAKSRHAYDRATLITTLRRHDTHATATGRFIPVFAEQAPQSEVVQALCQLQRRHGDIVLPPCFESALSVRVENHYFHRLASRTLH